MITPKELFINVLRDKLFTAIDNVLHQDRILGISTLGISKESLEELARTVSDYKLILEYKDILESRNE